MLEIEWSPLTKSLNVLNHYSDEKTHIIEPSTQITPVCQLKECLAKSCTTERLDESNKWYCSRCKKHVKAFKTYEMYSVPKFLVLHLMRFKSKHYLGEKNNTLVEFPLEGLDLSEVILSKEKPRVYDLYAVSNHYGGLGGGHYTAFARHGDAWFEMDDSRISPVPSAKVQTAAAYLLFYKQRE